MSSLDSDQAGGQSDNDRMTVEGAISVTDAIVASKERQIEELKQSLAEKDHAPPPPSGTASEQQILDADETIRKGRVEIERLREELREKQRQAEIEIAVERAKIARDKAELEEKTHAAGAGDRSRESEAQPSRGQWLTKLGLKSPDAD